MTSESDLWIDDAGCGTLPDMPRVCWRAAPPTAAQLTALLADFGQRVSIGWDPMDASGLAMLGDLGFNPAGTGPWRAVGGSVHWVTGYEDATGAVLDLIRPAPCSPDDGC